MKAPNTQAIHLPYFPFYPADWMRQTRMLSPTAKAAWIDIICALWTSRDRRGIETMPRKGWVRFLGLTEIETLEVILDLRDAGLLEYQEDDQQMVEIRCLRMCEESDQLIEKIKAESERASQAASKRWKGVKAAKAGAVQSPTPACSRIADALPNDAISDTDTDTEIDSDTDSESETNTEGDVHNHHPRTDDLPSQSLRCDGGKSAPQIPSLEQTRTYAVAHGLDREIAVTWWHEREGEGWKRLTGNWGSNLTAYVRKWEANRAERRARTDAQSKPTQYKPFSEMTDEEIIRASQ